MYAPLEMLNRYGKGQHLWKRAKKIIPGGNMLLSKRAEMFLPEIWPSYFSKSKGCKVWDLDGNKYIDMSIMGIGTNSLGYGHEKIDNAVIETVRQGNMCTLNAPEEVLLAEKLITLHPWAHMVRFARSGGEANSIAIRIARAASGKDQVAICGYHGWHDWYLAANLGDNKNLDGHLLPGLKPTGVPRTLKGTVLPFKYNDLKEIRDLIQNNNIGVIKMEVMRSEKPKDGYLEAVRQLADENGIVLIFDECTSGFRESLGGIHKNFKVTPDIAMFGKALGNGYAITAIVGKANVMEAAQDSFISSTFWTERIGPTAALKTLEVMEEEKSWEHLVKIGKQTKTGWSKIAARYELDINITGIDAIPAFSLKSSEWLSCKTYITQEMLKKGYLASNILFCSTAHKSEMVDDYMDALDNIFDKIARYEREGTPISEFLEGPVCHDGFKRLN